jgi:ketosteroid isomerase-like protein
MLETRKGRRVVATFAIALATAGHAIASAEAETSADAAAAMQATQDACAAWRTGDAAALERLLADGFTLVGSDAGVQTREEVLAEVRTGEPRYERFENVDMTARLWGDVAMVRGVTRLKGAAAGAPFELEVRFTDLLVREDGRWRLVSSHVTRLPAAP